MQLNLDIFRDDKTEQNQLNEKQPETRKTLQREISVLRRKFLHHLSARDKQMASCVVFLSFDVTV